MPSHPFHYTTRYISHFGNAVNICDALSLAFVALCGLVGDLVAALACVADDGRIGGLRLGEKADMPTPVS